MVYSNKAFPNKEFEFPPPPLWLTWTAQQRWNTATRQYEQGDSTGPVRHQDSLAKAKKYLSGYANSYNGGVWHTSWAIYEWTGQKYELRYSGKEGDKKSDHPLWQETIKKSELKGRDVTDDEFEEALKSVGKSIQFMEQS